MDPVVSKAQDDGAVRGETPCPQVFAGRERRWVVGPTSSVVVAHSDRQRTHPWVLGRYHTEEGCFGVEIVPAKVPGGPTG